jgi:predicted nucleic acid-binding protein
VRFWDASAIIPLLIEEARSGSVESEYRRDPEFVVWWGTDIECVSALARRERDGILERELLAAALARLDLLGAAWQEVQPSQSLRRAAIRLLRVHALRAADALQLAAAVAASEGDSRSLVFVTLDDRLAQAAAREGFPIADIPRS